MEKVRPWGGQPSDRARLRNRIEQHRSIYAAYFYRPSMAWSVGLSVCLSVRRYDTAVSPAKMTQPIGMPFGLRTRVDARNHVLDGGPDPPEEETILRGAA